MPDDREQNDLIQRLACWPKWLGYTIVIVAEIVLTAGLVVLEPYFPLGRYLVPYIFILMIAAYLLGEGPALTAFIVGLFLFNYFFVPPVYHVLPSPYSLEGWTRLTAFILGNLVAGLAAVLVRRSHYSIQRLAEGLRESKEQVTETLESISDAFYALDHEWRVIYVNAGAESLLRKTRDQLMGRRIWDEFPAIVGSAFEREYRRAMAEQEVVVFEEWYAPFGKWFEVRVYPYEGGLSVYFRDITERKRAEEALHVATQRLRYHIENTPLALVEFDPEFRVTRWSDQAQRVFGWAAEEIVGQRLVDMPWVYVEDVEKVRQLCEDMISGKRPRNVFSNRNYRKDGSVIYCEWYNSAMHDPSGKLISILSLVLDVTKREQARKLLRESQERLSRIIRTVPSGVVTLDMDGHIIYANRPALDMLGTPRGEAIGRAHNDPRWRITKVGGELIPDEDLPFARVVKSGEPVYGIEHAVWRSDGTRVIMSINAAPMLDAKNRIMGVVVSLNNITEAFDLRRTIERQLMLLQQALAPSVPSIGGGYRVAAAYLPAFAGQEIGGDFYDVFTTEKGQAGILIGDVCGKGIEAAALAAATKSTIRAFAYDLGSPEMALAHANAVLFARESETMTFVTVFLMILDLPTGGFAYSSAGHPPMAIRRASGEVEMLGYGNPPVGISAEVGFNGAQARLSPGDKIVLYTDGILEARGKAGLFEMAGVQRVLDLHGHESPDDLAREMFEAARQWTGGTLHDDAAIVVVERPAFPSPGERRA